MSIHIMNAVWQHGPQDRNGRMLLLAIADNANERGEAFPSLAVLGQKACMSKSVVIRTLQRLDAEGWLSVRKRAAAPEEYGRARGNLYVVALAKLRLSSYGSAKQKTAAARGVSSTPRQKVASATAADCESSAAANPRGVNSTPRQDSVLDEVSKPADEVSKTARRGVKSGVALIVEPSEPSLEPSPLPPNGGSSIADSVRESQRKFLEEHVAAFRRKHGPDEPLPSRIWQIVRHWGIDAGPAPPAEVEPDPSPPPAPMAFPGRRRRRLTQVQMEARVGLG